MEDNQRNIMKIGELQIKVRKKGGTLLRKKVSYKYLNKYKFVLEICL